MEKAGDVNPLLEMANKIGLDQDDEEAQETESKPSANEPAVGSYEAFMSTFGNPSRWAGRS